MARRPASDGSAGFFSPAAPRVLAHRGLALDAPENTLLAFVRALSLGVTHLETDVHASADGQAIVAHDPDLRRVADRDVRVNQLTAAELRRIDLGEGQSFCTLPELLDAFPDARVNIDVKSADAVAPTIEAIRAANAVDRVLIASFSAARRLPVVRALPGVATSLSSDRSPLAVAAARLGARALVRGVTRGVHAVQLPPSAGALRTLTPGSVAAFHAAGLEVHAWTINDPAEMRRLLDAGVDGIVTDRADLALEVLAARA